MSNLFNSTVEERLERNKKIEQETLELLEEEESDEFFESLGGSKNPVGNLLEDLKYQVLRGFTFPFYFPDSDVNRRDFALHSYVNDLPLELQEKLKEAQGEGLQETYLKRVISELTESLDNEDSDVRSSVTYLLGYIGSTLAIPGLLKALDDEDPKVREKAVEALGNIQSQKAVEGLLKALNDKKQKPEIRLGAAFALGDAQTEQSTEILLDGFNFLSTIHLSTIDSLNDKGVKFYEKVIEALGKTQSEQAIERLLKVVNERRGEETYHYKFYQKAIDALTHLGHPIISKYLCEILLRRDDTRPHGVSQSGLPEAIFAIQQQCGFYNYEIAQAAGKKGKRQKVKGETEEKSITYQIGSVGNLSTGTVIIQGDQVGVKYELPALDGECSE